MRITKLKIVERLGTYHQGLFFLLSFVTNFSHYCFLHTSRLWFIHTSNHARLDKDIKSANSLQTLCWKSYWCEKSTKAYICLSFFQSIKVCLKAHTKFKINGKTFLILISIYSMKQYKTTRESHMSTFQLKLKCSYKTMPK